MQTTDHERFYVKYDTTIAITMSGIYKRILRTYLFTQHTLNEIRGLLIVSVSMYCMHALNIIYHIYIYIYIYIHTFKNKHINLHSSVGRHLGWSFSSDWHPFARSTSRCEVQRGLAQSLTDFHSLASTCNPSETRGRN